MSEHHVNLSEVHAAHEAELTLTQTLRGTLKIPDVDLEVCSRSGERLVTHKLGLHPVVVGSSANCDLVLADPHVSGEHAEFQLTEIGVVFRDRGSKNASWTGERRVMECTIPANTSVFLGNTTITVRHLGPREVVMSATHSFGAGGAIVLGQSILMRTLFAQLERVCHEHQPVVLVGEAGTGRTLTAHAIVERLRERVPFESVDCAQIRHGREAEVLLGTVSAGKRPGILSKASGGVVFLGNVDELPVDVGEALVRVLRTQQIIPVGATKPQQSMFRARVILSVKPKQLSKFGLAEYAQANDAFEIIVPPLRYRKDDIEMLVKAFLAQHEPPRTMLDLPVTARAFLGSHVWPGNVAELKRFVALCLSIESVKQYLAEYTGDNTQKPNLAGLLPLTFAEARQAVVDHFDRAYLKAKLDEFDGNVTRTAQAIGVTRQHLSQLKRDHGLGNDRDS